MLKEFSQKYSINMIHQRQRKIKQEENTKFNRNQSKIFRPSLDSKKHFSPGSDNQVRMENISLDN